MRAKPPICGLEPRAPGSHYTWKGERVLPPNWVMRSSLYIFLLPCGCTLVNWLGMRTRSCEFSVCPIFSMLRSPRGSGVGCLWIIGSHSNSGLVASFGEFSDQVRKSLKVARFNFRRKDNSQNGGQTVWESRLLFGGGGGRLIQRQFVA